MCHLLVLGALLQSRRASGLSVLVSELDHDRDAVVRAGVREPDQRDVVRVEVGVDLLLLLLEIRQEGLELLEPPVRVRVLVVSPKEAVPPGGGSSRGRGRARGSGPGSELVPVFFGVERAADEWTYHQRIGSNERVLMRSLGVVGFQSRS